MELSRLFNTTIFTPFTAQLNLTLTDNIDTFINDVYMTLNIIFKSMGVFYIVLVVFVIVAAYTMTIYTIRWFTRIAVDIIEFLIFFSMVIIVFWAICQYVLTFQI
jgi:hypothetical protein